MLKKTSDKNVPEGTNLHALKISKLSSGIGLRMGGATPYPLPHPYHGLVLPKTSVAKISKQEPFALQDFLSIKCAELINCHYSGIRAV